MTTADAPPLARSRATTPVGSTALAVGVLVLLGALVPLALAGHYGAFGIPRSDDWSYLVTEFRWIGGDGLSFNHWVSMSLVGQLVLASPVAWLAPRDIGALQIWTAAFGCIGLVAVYVGATGAGIAWTRALLLAATIAVSPLWAPLASSFMTDVPTFAATAGAVAFAIYALRDRTVAPGWWWASVTTALVACTIRQYAAITLVVVLATGWFTANDVAARRRVLRATALAVVFGVAFWLWWGTIPDGRALTPAFPDGHALEVVFYDGAGFLRLAGLLLAPVLVLAAPGARLVGAWRRRPIVLVAVGVGVGGWLLATAHAAGSVFVGNYVVANGVLSDVPLVGKRPDVLPGTVWQVVIVVASCSGLVLAMIAADAVVDGWARRRHWRGIDPLTLLLGLLVAGHAVVYAIAMATGIQVYDRYFLLVLPAAGMLLLRARRPALVRSRPRRRRAAPVCAVGAFVALAALGLAFAADSASYDGARWRVAEAAVRRGWKPVDVNGGFEWRNFQQQDIRRDGSNPVCVTVHVDPRTVPGEVVAVVTSSAPTRADARLVAFRTRTPCAEPGASP